VIKPDSCQAVDGEGMPLQGHPFEKGNLYIQFSVVFPETLDPQQVRLRDHRPRYHAVVTSVGSMSLDPPAPTGGDVSFIATLLRGSVGHLTARSCQHMFLHTRR